MFEQSEVSEGLLNGGLLIGRALLAEGPLPLISRADAAQNLAVGDPLTFGYEAVMADYPSLDFLVGSDGTGGAAHTQD